MKAISLWQPWATAVSLGHKRIETRSWNTNYRGPLAIHAAKRFGPDERAFAQSECAYGRLPKELPLGAIVATCILHDVVRAEQIVDRIGPIEKLYGDYGPGRYCWLLKNIKPLPQPIGCTGRQGFFEYPDELLS